MNIPPDNCRPSTLEHLSTLRRWIATRDRSECWEWPWGKSKGYGTINLGRPVLVHRLAWELDNGRPLAGFGCHHCDNRQCCNPSHIFDGTPADNSRDAKLKGRLKATMRPNHRHLLTDDDVREIRSDARPHALIAACYGVSPHYVYRIKKGDARGDVAA